MIKCVCLACGRDMHSETSILESVYVMDVICMSCRIQMKAYRKKIKLNSLIVEGLYPYQDYCRELMIQYKEYLDEALYPLFLYNQIRNLKKRYNDYVLVPMPSSKESIEKRGFHQVKEMFSVLNLPMVDVLIKNKDIDQKKLGYQKRQEIKDVIALKNSEYITGKKILLIDDILTSGATLKAAYNLVKPYAKSVKGLVICYNQHYLNDMDRMVMKYWV